ncbi:MAG: leucyl aminopeptidase [Candidatus Uhrbacteria bacterium]
MRYITTGKVPFNIASDAIVVPLTEAAVQRLPLMLRPLDQALDGLLSTACAAGDFRGEEHTTFTLLTNGKISSPRILLVGAGKPKDRTLLEWQHIIGAAARALQRVKAKRWALVIPDETRRAFRAEDLGRATAKGVAVATYQFHQYKSDPDVKLPLPEEIIVGPLAVAQKKQFMAGVAEGEIVGEAMNWIRNLGNMPSSDATPSFLATQAQGLAKSDKRFHLHVIERAEMEKLGMGALLGVNRGAVEPAKCIVLEYRGDARHAKSWRAFVGKAITFDSGGISIKPGDKMDEMKFDMSGGAAVLGALRAIAALGLRTNIVGVVPATENLPSGSAYKPGDILRTCRGKTIEIQNTDAEGRLILADGMGYALRYDPIAIIDVATLTGAIGVALGPYYTGLFTNNRRLFGDVQAAADASGDRCWHMPLGDAYTRDVKSDVADWTNIGKLGRIGGACTAAAFLEQFAEGKPWAHLDIAYTAWTTEQQPWLGKGATGVGVHLLVELAKGWAR